MAVPAYSTVGPREAVERATGVTGWVVRRHIAASVPDRANHANPAKGIPRFGVNAPDRESGESNWSTWPRVPGRIAYRRPTGNKRTRTWASIWSRLIGPSCRESVEWSRLSPIMKNSSDASICG